MQKTNPLESHTPSGFFYASKYYFSEGNPRLPVSREIGKNQLFEPPHSFWKYDVLISLVGLSAGSLSALSCLGLNYLIGSFDPVLLFIEAIISLLAGVFSTIPACKHNLTDVPTKRYEV